MYSGNSHTLNPEEWLTQFRERDYVLLSFVLQAPIEQCFNRVRQRKENAIVDHVEYQSLYDWFSKVQELGIFSEKAKVQEITIDARQEPKEIADEIMECIRKEKEKMGS
jgi:thymidylate kinase